jgi:alpha-beta hydrolase superfamily lysophospholipase
MTVRAQVEFDVSSAVGERAVIAASLVAPDGDPKNSVVLAIPGGTYSHSYWDADSARIPGYSFAEHLAAAGYVVVAVDNVGTGASTVPSGLVTPEQMAEALDIVSRELRARLADGSLTPGLAAMPDPDLVGIGHSLGGMLVALQQAAHSSYERVGIWGRTALWPPNEDESGIEQRIETIVANLRLQAGAAENAQFVRMPRARLRPSFYGDFVDEAVMEADEAAATTMSLLAGASAGADGYIADAAATITSPVLLVFGEQERPGDQHREPAAYRSSDDITLFVLRGSAHCHNLAPTRHVLWDRTIRWLAN